MKLLLPLTTKVGIDVNALTIDGRTALDLAKDGRLQTDSAVVDTLRDHGAEATLMAARNLQEGHGMIPKRKTELERLEKLKSAALSTLMPLAAIQAAISIIGLLWTSLSVHEVPWQLAHISRPLLARCASRLNGSAFLYTCDPSNLNQLLV